MMKWISLRSIGCLLVIGIFTLNVAAQGVTKETFGTVDGETVDLYTLRNSNGIEAQITNYEGIVVSVKMPDNEGNVTDIVLGYDTLAEYRQDDKNYFDGIQHGTDARFQNLLWEAEEFSETESVGVTLTSSFGQPQQLLVTVRYTLTEDNELRLDYTITAAEETVVNIGNPIYFNLAGAGADDIWEHKLYISGETFQPLAEGMQPMNEMRGVWGTPMNYTQPVAIGQRYDPADEQIRRVGGGYRHSWRLDHPEEGALDLAARVYEPESGRVLEIETTASGILLNTGNFWEKEIQGKGDTTYRRFSGFSLQARHFAASVKDTSTAHSTTFEAGETYTYTFMYKFYSIGR